MKNRLLLTIIFTLFLNNVFSQTVYTTKTGTKYHTQYCKYLKKSSYAISLSDAKAKGYDACSICKPNSTATSPSAPSTKKTESAPKSSSGSVQCSGTTKAGSRCKRMTTSSNGRCYQH